MQDSDASGRQDSVEPDWPLADSTQIRLLYVGVDEVELGEVASYVAQDYDNVTLVTDTDVTAAWDTVRRWPFDCLIVESDYPEEDWRHLVTEAPCPTILYTTTERELVDSELRDSVETIASKESGGRRALLARVLGIVQSRPRHEPEEHRDVVNAYEQDVQQLTGCFLVGSGGRIHWSNVALEQLLGRSQSNDTRGTQTDFYRRLAAQFEGGTETTENLTTLVESDRVRHGKVIRASVNSRFEYFRHSSYPVSCEQDDVRFEILEPATPQLQQYNRVRLFEELADNAVDGLFALDADGYIEYCNASYAAMAGYDREELRGAHISETMAPGELERAQNVLVDIIRSDRKSDTVDMMMETSEGSYIDVSYQIKPRETPGDEYGGLVGVIRDITERKQRERELSEYRTLVESAGDPMFVLDNDSHIEICNEAMVEFSGVSRETLVGMSIGELFSEERIEHGLGSLECLKEPSDCRWDSFGVWLTDAEDDERLFEVTVGVVDEDNHRTVATLRDVTDRHRKQEQIERIKQVFARSLRHNIRNRVSVIRGFASVLEQTVPEEERMPVERITEAATDLAATSEKVSNLEWIVDGDFKLVDHDLATLVAESVGAVNDLAADATVDVDVPSDVTVRGIRDLDFAVTNLVENALEHGTTSGSPTVSISVTDRTEEFVTLTVADDGPGIPAHEVRVIEQGEETALEHGSGLGLWLVDQVIEQSGGRLDFEVDDGTRAHLRLPRPSK